MSSFIDIVFDGPPSHESGRFIEVEDADGKSISIGEWVTRPGDPKGWTALRLRDPRTPSTGHLDDARERLANGNPNWTGPHPDFSLHTIATVLDAGFRDLLRKLDEHTERMEHQIEAHASELGRQRP